MSKLILVEPEYNISKDQTVIVVGSSGKLLDHNYGKFIDSHDVVIRFNDSSTKGFEKHVGSKTTIQVINQGLYQTKNYTKRRRFSTIFVMQHKDFGYKKWDVDADIYTIDNNGLADYCYDFFLNKYSIETAHLTCGFKVVTALAGSKLFPTCIGFGMGDKYHYCVNRQGSYRKSGTLKSRSGSRHDFDMEYKLHDLMHNDGLVRLIKL